MSRVLQLLDIGKYFGGFTALRGVDLSVFRGEFVCVVGASGSGKSTLLSIVAGLSRPSIGEVLVDGRPVTGPGPDRGFVFQSGAVFPWRTVESNVAFGLELLRLPRRERMARVEWYLAETDLLELRRVLPKHLSGGERQRVAIARALVGEPDVLLLDEPFGALDVQTRQDMEVFVHRLWQDTGATVLMVTHDVEEAVFLGQRVVVLAGSPGRVAADVAVDLPGEREPSVRRTPEFHELRAHIEDLVRQHHRRRAGAHR
jgi:NitT/TauT family transport system ATP-binding protein